MIKKYWSFSNLLTPCNVLTEILILYQIIMNCVVNVLVYWAHIKRTMELLIFSVMNFCSDIYNPIHFRL